VALTMTGRPFACLVIVVLAASAGASWTLRSGERRAVSLDTSVAAPAGNERTYSGDAMRPALRGEPPPQVSSRPESSSAVRPTPAAAPTNVRDHRPPLAHEFRLLGTTVAGKQGVAVLLESSNGRVSIVKPGDQLGAFTVMSINDARVTLGLGAQSEELSLGAGLSAAGMLPAQEVRPEEVSEAELSVSPQIPTLSQNDATVSPDLEVSSRLAQGGTVPNPR